MSLFKKKTLSVPTEKTDEQGKKKVEFKEITFRDLYDSAANVATALATGFIVEFGDFICHGIHYDPYTGHPMLELWNPVSRTRSSLFLHQILSVPDYFEYFRETLPAKLNPASDGENN